MAREFDYIICGGGTAGCVLASRLKHGDTSLSIALIERGKNDASNPMILNPLSVAQLKDVGLDTVYCSEPQPYLSGRRIELHGGNVLSGSSAVNYGVWMRGDRKDYDEWARIVGDSRWSYDGLLPYFKRAETHFDVGGDRSQHGFEGPIKTASNRTFPLRKPFAEAFEGLGFEYNSDQNGGRPFGYGPLVENWSPKRQPTALAYDLTGVVVISDTYIKRVLLEEASEGDDPKAVGVEVMSRESKLSRLNATREVIVSCGAYRTPQLLMLSGLGPREQLSRLGLRVLKDLPHVGSNLFDHLGCALCFKLDSQAAAEGLAIGNEKFMSNPKHLEGVVGEWSAIDTLSPDKLAEAFEEDSQSSSISEEQVNALKNERAHLWILPNYMPISLGDHYDVVPDGEHITIVVMNLQPTSRGSVGLKSINPADHPMIQPNYVATNHDRLVMREGVRKILRLAELSSLEAFIAGEEPPVGESPLTSTSSDEAIDSRIQNNAQSIQHPASTAAMGKVVDSRMRLKGVKCLRVCDASVFPAPVAATIQASVYAVAESLADMLLHDD